MFDKSDVLAVSFSHVGRTRSHKCVTRLPKEAKGVAAGTRFGVTCDSDARVGAELLMTLSDIQGEETLKVSAKMVTAEYLAKASRGWYSIVEVKEVLEYARN